MDKFRTIYMRAVTSIHAGAGQDMGVVDMPIQREITTGIPKIEASGLKGCFKEIFEEKEQNILFGTDKQAGIIGLIDARLLFFPVKSAKGIFALITCPFAIERYLEDIGKKKDKIGKLIDMLNNKINFLNNDKCYLINNNLAINDKIVMLDEYIFNCEILNDKSLNEDLKEYKELTPYIENIAVISNDNFFDFVSNHTEIVTRNKIDDITGTASDKGLFTEEYLPQESILYTTAIYFNHVIKDKKEDKEKNYFDIFINKMKNKKIQIGGNKTLGKGFINVLLEKEES